MIDIGVIAYVVTMHYNTSKRISNLEDAVVKLNNKLKNQ